MIVNAWSGHRAQTEENVMDTTAVAAHLGTTPRKLRAFLRSDASTFVAVGSGARYDFTDDDLPTLSRRFADWSGSPTPTPAPAPVVPSAAISGRRSQREIDAEVWAEEGPVDMPDIRNPAVRAAVRRIAEVQEARLDQMLLAAGLHITQMNVRRPAA
jgi:hypothetical protein